MSKQPGYLVRFEYWESRTVIGGFFDEGLADHVATALQQTYAVMIANEDVAVWVQRVDAAEHTMWMVVSSSTYEYDECFALFTDCQAAHDCVKTLERGDHQFDYWVRSIHFH